MSTASTAKKKLFSTELKKKCKLCNIYYLYSVYKVGLFGMLDDFFVKKGD